MVTGSIIVFQFASRLSFLQFRSHHDEVCMVRYEGNKPEGWQDSYFLLPVSSRQEAWSCGSTHVARRWVKCWRWTYIWWVTRNISEAGFIYKIQKEKGVPNGGGKAVALIRTKAAEFGSRGYQPGYLRRDFGRAKRVCSWISLNSSGN